MEHSALQSLTQKNHFISFAMPQIMALELQFSETWNMELVSANQRLFSTTEHRLSTILRECSAKIYALSEYEVFIQGSKHSAISYTDHKPIFFHSLKRINLITGIKNFI